MCRRQVSFGNVSLLGEIYILILNKTGTPLEAIKEFDAQINAEEIK
jgi:hypothetical protein